MSKGKIASFIKLEFIVEKTRAKHSKQIILSVRRDEDNNRMEDVLFETKGSAKASVGEIENTCLLSNRHVVLYHS